MAPYGADERPCAVCDLPARREPFCAGVAIQGETVAKALPREESPSLRHGYMDLDRFQEAHDDVLRRSRNAGREPPDLFAEAQRRIANGEATKTQIAR